MVADVRHSLVGVGQVRGDRRGAGRGRGERTEVVHSLPLPYLHLPKPHEHMLPSLLARLSPIFIIYLSARNPMIAAAG